MSATYCSVKSREMILVALKWSFNCLRTLAELRSDPLDPSHMSFLESCLFQGSGIYPSQDPWGKPFSRTYHKKRWELSGKRIAGPFVGCLDAILGDQDYIKTIMSPSRSAEISVSVLKPFSYGPLSWFRMSRLLCAPRVLHLLLRQAVGLC